MENNTFEILSLEEREVMLHFSKRTILNLEGPVRGVTIACESGVAWLTQQGDARDYILRAGGDYSAYREGQIVVQIMKDARITILLRDRLPGELRLSVSSNRRSRVNASLPRWKFCSLSPYSR
ncbi:MAG: DUF2917 domain-containing protein [Deltaproteobacteria bacterium]|nr:DUF2917 domain-containing protein [Deltaproteobacteria bacterium]